MSRRFIAVFVVLFLGSCSQAFAQSPCTSLVGERVYVSTGTGNQILCVDGSGVTVIYTDTATRPAFRPEDIVIGPDGKIYIMDTPSNRIWRMNQGGSQVEKIYDKNTAACTNSSGSPITCPSGPEGPSFSGSDDLYFNTHGSGASGAWKIPGIAAVPFQSSSYNPANYPIPRQAIPAFSNSGEGTAFDNSPGNLLLVDQFAGKVWRAAAPSYSSVGSSALITGLGSGSPFGVTVNTCGNILVATGNAILRYTSSGAFLNTYASFGSDEPLYLEVDSKNRVYVVTVQNPNNLNFGKVYRLDPTGASDAAAIASCSDPTATGTKTLLADLKSVLQSGTVPLLLTDSALGLALPPTSATITLAYSASQTSNIANFGFDSFAVEFSCVFNPFTVTVTQFRTKPSDVTFDNSFPSNTVPIRFAPLGGFAVQWKATTTATAEAGYFCASTTNLPAVKFVGVFNAIDTILKPGMASASAPNDNPIATNPFTTDITTDFWSDLAIGSDGSGSGGGADGLGTKYVVFNQGLKHNGVLTFLQPVRGQNQLINVGQSETVQILINDAVTGAGITDATARLSVACTNATVNVFPKGNSNAGNFFSNGTGSNKYSYQWDTFNVPVGSCTLTVFSDSVPPTSVGVTFNK